MFHKKASLEISIQAIVIVVLAMTLLGLGLGFIKGMFGNITDISKATFDKISDQLQRDLVNSNQKLVFSQTKINVERGKSVLLGWGIKNEGFGKLEYFARFNAINCPVSSGGGAITSQACSSITSLEPWFNYKKWSASKPKPYFVEAAAQKVERVELSVPSSATPGLYLVELEIIDVNKPTTDNIYEKTDIFVTIT